MPRGRDLDVQLIAGARLHSERGETNDMAKKAPKVAKKKGGKKR